MGLFLYSPPTCCKVRHPPHLHQSVRPGTKTASVCCPLLAPRQDRFSLDPSLVRQHLSGVFVLSSHHHDDSIPPSLPRVPLSVVHPSRRREMLGLCVDSTRYLPSRAGRPATYRSQRAPHLRRSRHGSRSPLHHRPTPRLNREPRHSRRMALSHRPPRASHEATPHTTVLPISVGIPYACVSGWGPARFLESDFPLEYKDFLGEAVPGDPVRSPYRPTGYPQRVNCPHEHRFLC